ncbi:MAG: O-antigen ligase family protein [Nitrospirae bacterium]|nr:O-antigen ligase family protein [Nitrospirota bacterium]
MRLSILFHRIDVFTIGILFPLSLIEYYKNKGIINRPFLILLISVFGVFFSGLMSGAVNNNPLLPTIHGSFDYIKYFLVIFIYAAFFREQDEFVKVFRPLLIVAIFIGVIAFIQEAWAMYSRYILKENIQNIFYIEIPKIFQQRDRQSTFFANSWRFGMYRVSSLMLNHNYLGLYCLLIFNVYSFATKRGKFIVFFSLLSGTLGSFSRIVYTSFTLVAGLQILRGRKWLILLLIPVAVFLFEFSFNSEQNLLKPTKSVELSKNTGEIAGEEGSIDSFYRKHTREKAIEIWKDHVIWGAGPSMYGGALSVKYNSPLYDYKAYNIMPLVVLFLKEWGTIDQFWPQVLAELGIVGIILFVWLFVSLTIMLFSFRNKAASQEVKNLFTAFIVYMVVILVYTFGLTLNLTPILFTCFAFIGIASGFVIRSS